MPKSTSKRAVLASAYSLRTIAPIPVGKDGSDILERSARAELAALDSTLLDDDAWSAARDNLLRFFTLLQAFVEPDAGAGENEMLPAIRDKIARS